MHSLQTVAKENQIWHQLQVLAEDMPTIQQLFANEPKRGSEFMTQACGIVMDFSKQKIDTTALQMLLTLATASRLSEHIHKLITLSNTLVCSCLDLIIQ